MSRWLRSRSLHSEDDRWWLPAKTWTYTVADFVPSRFAACLRVLHPFTDADENPVSWRSHLPDDAWPPPAGWQFEEHPEAARLPNGVSGPDFGDLHGIPLRALLELAVASESEALICLYWDGFNEPTRPYARQRTIGRGRRRRYYRSDATLAELLVTLGPHPPEVVAPSRRPTLVVSGSDDLLWPRSPTILVPASGDWLLATDPDLDSSYLGCSEALATAVRADPRVEAVDAQLTDRI